MSTQEEAAAQNELEEIAGAFGDLAVSELIQQLSDIPPNMREKILDKDTSNALNKLVTPEIKKPEKAKKTSSRTGGTSATKTDSLLRTLSFAAKTDDEGIDETAAHTEIDALERLSQLSEKNAAEIESLKQILHLHDERLKKQAQDIALLLGKNTELQRELSSLRAISQPPLTVSHGSKAGHYVPSETSATKSSGKEIKAGSLDTSALTENPITVPNQPKSAIKKRLDV